MANLSVYTDMINFLGTAYQDKQEEDAAEEALAAIDTATLLLMASKITHTDGIGAAVGCLMNAGLVEEASGLFIMWWEA